MHITVPYQADYNLNHEDIEENKAQLLLPTILQEIEELNRQKKVSIESH